MITVHLDNLHFNSFHGIHDEERILGNEYIVDCLVDFHENTEVIVHINDTINYVIVYDIIKKRMSVPTHLLETVAMEIGYEIHKSFPDIRSISVSITKLHPPIENIEGSVGVKWHREF
ncbi:MAG: dihydroneopterin aldolase [Ginsengibacter sp.]